MSTQITRRVFSAGLATAGVTAATKTAAFGVLGANEKVGIGVIGLGNRGDQLINAFKVHPDVEFVALCDVYEPYIGFAKKKVGGNPFTTGDYRKLLERKDVDAVIIATPDHWHALPFIEACTADKDVYVEKPLSLVVEEGRKMVQTADRYNRITQVGTQRRSSPTCRRIAELIQTGAIGKVTVCRCFHLTNESPIGLGKPADCDPPAGLDWNMWLGPAPKVPYNPNRCLYQFRWFRDYSGGQMTNFGTHFLDVMQWAIGQDAPAEIVAMGSGKGIDDNRQIPVSMEAAWKYPDGTLATYSQFNANNAPCNLKQSHIEFRGTEGTIYYMGWATERIEIVPQKVRTEPLPALSPLYRQENNRQANATKAARKPLTEKYTVADADHARNFLDGIKTRKPCHAPVEVGHRSTSTTLLANVAYDRQKYLLWDGKNERFTNDDEANKLLSYEYRPPWKLPSVK